MDGVDTFFCMFNPSYICKYARYLPNSTVERRCGECGYVGVTDDA